VQTTHQLTTRDKVNAVLNAKIHYVEDFMFLGNYFEDDGGEEFTTWCGPLYSSIDIETEAVLSPHDGAIATVQIELNGECWVVHWDKSLVMQDVEGADLFRAYLESPKVTKIIHNASFELMFFYEAFGPTLKCRPIHDTMAGEYILSEGSGFDEDSPKFTSSILGLGAVVFRMYGVEMDKDKAIRTSFRRKGNVQVIPPARQGTGVCGHDGCLAPCDVLVGGDELPLCGFHAEDPSYKRYKKRQAVSASEFVEHRVTHTKLTARQLNYAAFDALWCGVLAPDQIEAMAMKDIMEGEKFTDLFTMDCKATEVIARMQWKGIPVNVTALMCLDAEFQFEEEELRELCLDQTSLTYILAHINSTCDPNLTYEELALQIAVIENTTAYNKAVEAAKKRAKTAGTEYKAPVAKKLVPAPEFAELGSADKMPIRLNLLDIPVPSYESFELKRHDSQICRNILDWKSVARLQTNYTDGLLSRVNEKTQRIHCQINQFNTATGRLSIENPPLQQLPSRTKKGRQVRSTILAPAGKMLVVADYSQIELRLIAEMYFDEVMIEAFRTGKDLHSLFASKMLGVSYEEVEAGKDGVYKDKRSQAKPGNFGLGYGAGVNQFIFICWTQYGIALTYDEAVSIRSMWLDLFYGVAAKHDQMKRDVKNGSGPMRFYTQDGRVRRLPRTWVNSKGEHKTAYTAGLNHPIQGTSADMIKKVMIELNELYCYELQYLEADLILQVHDELVTEANEHYIDECAALVKSTMERIGQTYLKLLPIGVDVKTAHAWTK